MSKSKAMFVTILWFACIATINISSQEVFANIGVRLEEVYKIHQERNELKGTTSKESFIASDSTMIEYLLYRPEQRNEKYPLILYLHGSNLRGSFIDVLLNFGLTGAVANYIDIPAYVISPQLPWGRYWGEIAPILMQIVDDVGKRSNVDSDRIIITGHSLGGVGTYIIGAMYPEKFSCIVPVSGEPYDSDISKYKNKTVLIVVGEEEKAIVEISKTIKDKICMNQGIANLIIIPEGTHTSVADQLYFDKRFYDIIFSVKK